MTKLISKFINGLIGLSVAIIVWAGACLIVGFQDNQVSALVLCALVGAWIACFMMTSMFDEALKDDGEGTNEDSSIAD